MSNPRRRFSEEQKLEILNQAEKMGITNILREHRLSYSVFAKWKQKYMNPETNIQVNVLPNKTKLELKQLTEENQRLRKIIAAQALALEQREEELRKHHGSFGKR